jgi:hypothetical protein
VFAGRSRDWHTYGIDKRLVFEIELAIAAGVSKVIHYKWRYKVPTKNPRINVALEKPLYLVIEKLAKQRGLSLSMVTRDLIREALEIHEDTVLSTVAEEREATLIDRKTLSHDEVWG